MSATEAEQSAHIHAGPQACFEAIADFESYPEWQTAVKRCEVLERDEQGRGRLVETVIDAKLREVRYRLRYEFEPPHRVWWDYVEGDVHSVEGEFVFEPEGEGRTRATYRLAIDPGRFVPGPVRRVLVEGVMRGAVRDLKRRVEEG
jgi:ribosome-associated toxin RatA of RatAB toxin-antitoxin module